MMIIILILIIYDNDINDNDANYQKRKNGNNDNKNSYDKILHLRLNKILSHPSRFSSRTTFIFVPNF